MSRCFPYNPLARGAGSGALIEPIKLQKKEKAEEKKERKREKKKQKKLHAELNGGNTKSADQCHMEWKHSVRNQLDKKSNQCPKAYEDESEQLDKSGLTEEHDLVYVPSTQGQDSPNSSRSKKQKLDVPEPSRVGHAGGRVVRIRMPTGKPTEPEQPKPRELLLPTPVPIPKLKQPEQPKPRELIPPIPVPIAKLKPLDQLNPTELLLPTRLPIGKRKQSEQSKPRELSPSVLTAMPKKTEQPKPRELSARLPTVLPERLEQPKLRELPAPVPTAMPKKKEQLKPREPSIRVPTAMPERLEQPKHRELASPVPTTRLKKPEQSGPRELLLQTLVPATAKPKEPEQPRLIEQPPSACLPTSFAEPPCFSGRMESAAVQDGHLRWVADALPVENHGESDAASPSSLGRDSKGFSGSKRSRRKAAKCENLFSNWNPPALVPADMPPQSAGDDEDWLFGSKGTQLQNDKKRCRDESEPCADASALYAWPPRACSIQGTDLYGLPYVVPF